MNDLDIKKIRKELGLSQKELASKVEVHWRTVQNWEQGGEIPLSAYTRICALTNSQNTLKTQIYAGDEEVNIAETVLLLPISAQGGSLNDFTISVKETDCEKIISPIKGADFAMTVTGESMSPEYPSGSQILIKKIDEKAFINWGNVFVLDTCNGTVIKKLFPTEKPDTVVCKSINPEYPPFEVDLKDVFGIYRVLLCMSIK